MPRIEKMNKPANKLRFKSELQIERESKSFTRSQERRNKRKAKQNEQFTSYITD